MPFNLSNFIDVYLILNIGILDGCQWLTLVILATQETEIRRISVRSQPGQTVHKDPISKISSKISITKKGWHSGSR
jgi:hypothetical protein